jgi:Acetyltransferase (GNAT) family.
MMGIDWRWISNLSDADYSAMTALAVKQYHAQAVYWRELGVDWNTPQPKTVHTFMAAYVKNAAIKVTIKQKGVMIGFALLSVEQTDKGMVCHIDEVFIDEEHRGKGIGTATLTRIKRHAEKQKIAALTLNVSSINPVRRLYERMGFKSIQVKYQLRLE